MVHELRFCIYGANHSNSPTNVAQAALSARLETAITSTWHETSRGHTLGSVVEIEVHRIKFADRSRPRWS
jgi:hypothetical protein